MYEVNVFKYQGDRYIKVERFGKIYSVYVKMIPLMSEENKHKRITQMKEHLCQKEKKLCMK